MQNKRWSSSLGFLMWFPRFFGFFQPYPALTAMCNPRPNWCPGIHTHAIPFLHGASDISCYPWWRWVHHNLRLHSGSGPCTTNSSKLPEFAPTQCACDHTASWWRIRWQRIQEPNGEILIECLLHIFIIIVYNLSSGLNSSIFWTNLKYYYIR